MTAHVVLGILLALAMPALAATNAGDGLAGTWKPEKAELSGGDFPLAAFGGAVLRLTAGTYEFGGDKGTIELLGGEPATMDIHGKEGPNAGRTIRAIYRLSGDDLVVCYQLGQGERPADFASPKGTQVLLIHYKRA